MRITMYIERWKIVVYLELIERFGMCITVSKHKSKATLNECIAFTISSSKLMYIISSHYLECARCAEHMCIRNNSKLFRSVHPKWSFKKIQQCEKFQPKAITIHNYFQLNGMLHAINLSFSFEWEHFMKFGNECNCFVLLLSIMLFWLKNLFFSLFPFDALIWKKNTIFPLSTISSINFGLQHWCKNSVFLFEKQFYCCSMGLIWLKTNPM